MAESIYRENHRIIFPETNFLKNAKLSSLLDMINLVSQDQTTELGVGLEKLLGMDCAWVIIQYDCEISQMPKVNQEVVLETRATSYSKFFAYREFWIRDQAGNTLVHFDSLWVMMDLKKRKMIKIKEEAVAPFHGVFAKKIHKLKKLPKFDDADMSGNSQEASYHVRFSDIDWNGHVNNSKYIDWMTDVLGLDFLSTHVPTGFSIKFLDEVRYGNDVTSTARTRDDDSGMVTTTHQISADGKPRAIAQIDWKETSKEK